MGTIKVTLIYTFVLVQVFLPSSIADYAGLQQSEFSFIKNYISERETKYLTSMKIQTDPRDETHEEFVVGIRFRFYRQNVNARDIFSLALPGVDFELVLRGSTALDETQVDSLFEEDLKSYIEETRNLVDNFDSYSVEMKTAFVDSHFLMYATQTFWNDINDADKNLAQVCVNHYTHDPVFAKASSDEFKVRLQGDCGLIMDYARSINDSMSTYDPCYDDLLFPYGAEFGDNVNEKNDDGGSGEYFVSIPFPFFDENHDSLWVNTNGVISFLTEVMTFTPDPFPLDDNRRLVAPFWADVDTRIGGDVYFREVTDPNDRLLKKTKELIVQQFADHQKFEVMWLFIATWDDVAFYGSSPIGNLRNTFQCVLATNGRHSFALYHYGNVTWTTGAASQGDPDTGLGGIPAQVGFNAGDGINFVLVNGSRTQEVVNIDTWGNVDVAGRFLFQIDNKQMAPGGCNTEGVLSVYPSFGYMLGGQRIYVSGPCFDNTVEISCKFGDNVVKATMESAVVATCTTPIFYEVGRIEFRLSADGGVSFDKYRGIFTVVSEEYRTSTVKRVDSANWHTLNDLTIEWDTSEFLTSRLHVSLYGYVEDVSAGLNFITHLSPDPIDNSGRYTFTRQPENGASFHAGVIRLSDHEVNFDDHPQSLWSDIHPLKWKYNVDSYTFCKDTLYSDSERNLEFLDDLEPCPCTLQQARLDTGRYTAHPRCNEAWSHNDDNCHRKLLAHHCVRVNEPSAKGAGQQCCYDEKGNLLMEPIRIAEVQHIDVITVAFIRTKSRERYPTCHTT
ncbi:uncharacterized protein K03H1.5-like [Ptychodera flava]|uniref:uncharacterized protein K03H1.5-like n=1 Tax=Ptychodera flava TaxID=63121 RepID=UPI00396A54E8